MSASRQLPLPFASAPDYSAADFLEAPANAEARTWLARPADWPSHRLVLWGERGVGKSHLLHIWAGRVGAPVLAGAALAAPVAHPVSPLALDDADAAGSEPSLLHLLNAAAEAGLPLLMTARSPPFRWPVRLPDLASRLAATAAVEVRALDDALLGALFGRLLAARQLEIAPPLVIFLLARLPRHPGALAQAAARLDSAGLAAGGPVTRSLALAALSPLITSDSETDRGPAANSSPSAHPLL